MARRAAPGEDAESVPRSSEGSYCRPIQLYGRETTVGFRAIKWTFQSGAPEFHASRRRSLTVLAEPCHKLDRKLRITAGTLDGGHPLLIQGHIGPTGPGGQRLR